jgi:hypothetical protein
MDELGSILAIISQSRSSVNPMRGYGEQRVTGGGHAPDFYADIRVWTKISEKLYRKPKGSTTALKIGNLCRFDVERTRVTGRPMKIDVPIYYSHGIDDLGGCVRYLLEWKRWKLAKGDGEDSDDGGLRGVNDSTKIVAPDFNYEGTMVGLIKQVEAAAEDNKLRMLVQQVWDEIKAACALERKPRYID